VSFILHDSYTPNASWNVRSSDEERDSNVKLVRHRFAFDESVLTEMVAVVGCVDDVRVLQLSQPLQLSTDLQHVETYLVTFRVSRRPRETYCGHARLCVCVSVCLSVRGRMPTLLHGPGCNLGEW